MSSSSSVARSASGRRGWRLSWQPRSIAPVAPCSTPRAGSARTPLSLQFAARVQRRVRRCSSWTTPMQAMPRSLRSPSWRPSSRARQSSDSRPQVVTTHWPFPVMTSRLRFSRSMPTPCATSRPAMHRATSSRTSMLRNCSRRAAAFPADCMSSRARGHGARRCAGWARPPRARLPAGPRFVAQRRSWSRAWSTFRRPASRPICSPRTSRRWCARSRASPASTLPTPGTSLDASGSSPSWSRRR